MKDKYGREVDYLRISLTDNCNLRCIYCMEEKNNTFLKKEDKLTNDEIYKIVCESAKLGIKKVRFTGGEPLVRKDIVELMQRINTIQGIEEIYLTTNGILLEENVEILAKAGLKGVNISLDSLKKETFKRLTRLGDLNKVLAAIDKCISLGIKVKLNTVMIEDINDDEIIDFVNLTLQKPIDVRFIELMPIGVGSKYKGINNEVIIDIIKNNYKDFEEVKRIKSGGPATYIKLKDAKGKIGFISAISNCFCEDCNRIRLTPEGFLKQCLHFNYGIDLKELIRKGASDNELSLAIENSIFDKPEKHLFMQKSNDKELKFMNQIGG
ncbi:GTP 3',8-cyclase MoaA [Clostridium tertium]|jgi:cyclic pyranopterin phosphate synthase|uniref:GTP 3',8-cyclase MoaA n=1 Tax=Clostridium TaxID=1485 RepID=UPI000DD0D965|nr:MULTISPECIES: GTP 3',8-cyclase MoaA [Clostridium]MDB1923934.1 GTP 3',8-cyclase MoaA [Clostridium tertium]MDB1927065.1 GTP 3',8-cyclase MoaA [Clostridium tertium]MDB1930777.1 GTP 3',8-cyclase MoaA [Clostridium tertium]MDB1969536.1 GTP 3',8-cyclase MoaA [Clostridium tertium]MDU2157970.1 GTP 3',8-cyclase MoaA [Clostridium sp.]